ncbi:type IV secretion system protein [Brevundimonas nasdae]|uniref:type IV secretion system protein n=1 Tax=Brevundimonas nasdae TaxID=172043 RepID=UPI003F68F7A0
MFCTAPGSNIAFIGGMLRFVDCEVQTIASRGYQAVSATSETYSVFFAGILTLFVALWGYRVLLGHVPSVREGVVAACKIGVVMMLTTSWPAWQILVHDLALHAPAELYSHIGGSAELPGASGQLLFRLERVDAKLANLAVAGVGQVALDERVSPLIGGFDALALGSARILYLIGVVGAFVSTRLLAALCLALGPIFVGCLLFDGTRGLFEGWARLLLGAALGGLAATLLVGLEIALLEPWLNELLLRRAGGGSIPRAPVELLVVTTVFGLALAVAILGMVRLAAGFRLGWVSRTLELRLFSQVRALAERAGATHDRAMRAERPSRAAALALSLAAGQRREALPTPAALTAGGLGSISVVAARANQPVWKPLGQSYRRRINWRRPTGVAGVARGGRG